MQIPEFNKAIKAYSGRPGCMCGCRGKWTRTSHTAECQHMDISDRSVRIIMGKLARSADVKRETVGEDTEVYYTETPTRMLGVYFRI